MSYAIAKANNNKVIIFGGDYGNYPNFSQLDDLWEFDAYDTSTWTEINITSSKPSERGSHKMSSVNNNMIILFGGGNNYIDGDYINRFNDTWEYDIDSNTWSEN
ncbi:MAG: kelch repeat-containing protein [Spirochaetota bacterium]|nr:kelch repeat-containing protein [Spirochaetota bacterium]